MIKFFYSVQHFVKNVQSKKTLESFTWLLHWSIQRSEIKRAFADRNVLHFYMLQRRKLLATILHVMSF